MPLSFMLHLFSSSGCKRFMRLRVHVHVCKCVCIFTLYIRAYIELYRHNISEKIPSICKWENFKIKKVEMQI